MVWILFGCYIKNITQPCGVQKIRYDIIFDIAQKHIENKIVLDKLIILFNTGKVNKHSVPNVWYYRVTGVNNCSKLLEYFDKYTLKSNYSNTLYYIIPKFIHYIKYL